KRPDVIPSTTHDRHPLEQIITDAIPMIDPSIGKYGDRLDLGGRPSRRNHEIRARWNRHAVRGAKLDLRLDIVGFLADLEEVTRLMPDDLLPHFHRYILRTCALQCLDEPRLQLALEQRIARNGPQQRDLLEVI